jgi:GT2 family glycosyltransferase
MTARVTYIVVAYRSADDLVGCLDAIMADTDAPSRVIVVNNASPDESAAIAATHPLRPVVIRSERNVGFGGGCNLALAVSTTDLVFLVNPDARIRPGTTATLVAALEADPAAVAVGPRVEGPSGPSGAGTAGFEPSVRSALGHFLLLARVPGVGAWFPPLQLPAGRPAQRVDWVSGAVLLARRTAVADVGGFDPSLFLYMEDVDLCRRLRETGGAIRYEPSAVVDHALGGSQDAGQARRWYDAFHAYVARRRGGPYARAVSAVAAVGLALRAVALALRGSREARRLALAARTAARHVVAG